MDGDKILDGDKALRALFPTRTYKLVHKSFALTGGQITDLRKRNDELRRQPRFASPFGSDFVTLVNLRIEMPDAIRTASDMSGVIWSDAASSPD